MRYVQHFPYCVYFARSTATGHVKIGYTKDLNARLSNIRSQLVNTPALELLGTAEGAVEREDGLHRKFSADHVGGEWFRPTPALLAAIDAEATAPEIEVPRPTFRIIPKQDKEMVPVSMPSDFAYAVKMASIANGCSVSEEISSRLAIALDFPAPWLVTPREPPLRLYRVHPRPPHKGAGPPPAAAPACPEESGALMPGGAAGHVIA